MDIRIKELIAVGTSVTANSQPCLNYHVSKPREIGVDGQEIVEAIAVARTVRKGAMSNMDQFASTVVKDTETTMNFSEIECGCK